MDVNDFIKYLIYTHYSETLNDQETTINIGNKVIRIKYLKGFQPMNVASLSEPAIRYGRTLLSNTSLDSIERYLDLQRLPVSHVSIDGKPIISVIYPNIRAAVAISEGSISEKVTVRIGCSRESYYPKWKRLYRYH